MTAKQRRAAEVERLLKSGRLTIPRAPVLSFAQLAAALAVTERELEHVGPDGARQILRAHDEKARSR
jgi:hypothetical protein